MGVRKHNTAEARKQENKNKYFARLVNCPTSPRKMRLVADLIRGKKIDSALSILRFTNKDAAGRLEKLLRSAIANWTHKNEGSRIEEANLVVSEVFVDSARQLKRLRTAPQGRGYRVRKRSNHVTLVLGQKAENSEITEKK